MAYGTFSEEALDLYEELVRANYKEKKVVARQGTEKHTNFGISDEDSSFIDTGESQDADDYSEWEDWSFTTCLRPDGSLYGISRGKCRQGSEIDKAGVKALQDARKSPKQKQREAIRKRGETAVRKDKAERILKGLQKEGARDKKPSERRAKTGKGEDREEQLRQVRAKAFLAMDRLKAKVKKMKPGPQKQKVEARIDRLKEILGRLDKAQQKARDAKPKMGDGMGTLPDWAGTGKRLLG